MLKKARKLINNYASELLKLTALGFLSGMAAAVLIIAFRFFIEYAQSLLLPGNNPENYEALPPLAIFLLPLFGGMLIGLIFHFLPPAARLTGLIHTIDVFRNEKGHLPLINTMAQFIGATISIIAGHSVGREGPSIHLGASSGGFVTYIFQLSDKTRRILLACGVAAAIAASFNTPIAGVIFSLEVIMLEYMAISTIPIVVASATATILSQAVFGNTTLLEAPNLGGITGVELSGMLINGAAIGLVAVIFIRLLVDITQRSKPHPIFLRLTLAGAITGLLALGAPEIMSIGYDTISELFQDKIALYAIILILMLKVLATTIGLGLGLPGGLIGPTLVIGALTGSVVGIILQNIFPEMETPPGMYAMIGMGAMMGATLQAPLAALIAIFELTLNPHIILPGLLAVVVASLTSSELLKQPSIIIALMRAREIDHDESLLTEEIADTPITDLIRPMDDQDKENKYKIIKIPLDATLADAVAAFRKTHNNQIFVYNINDTNKSMLGIINKNDLSDYLRQFEENN